MINFTVGPVQSSDAVRAIGGENVPYFRTAEFSDIMLDNERLIKKFAHTTDDSRVVFMTCSGSGGMETAIMNTLTRNDKALVINGGSFGERFVELLKLHEIPFTEIKLEHGKALRPEHLAPYEGKGYTAFLLQKHETSTGVHYDINLVSDFCKRNGCFMIVDTISTFLCDPFDMAALDAGVMITGSQKALACPPGVSIIVLGENAIKRVENNESKSIYFDLKDALKNGVRGQTPFTPAVTILLQINARLKEIKSQGGVESEIQRISTLAYDFRKRIKDLPLEVKCNHLGNAVTAVYCNSPHDVVDTLKKEYFIWVNPSGGEVGDKMFRVGHIGNLTIEDNDKLIEALKDLEKRGILK